MARKRQGKVGEAKSEIVAEIPAACADESLAVAFFEKRRWGDCPCCPRCGDTNVYAMTDAKTGGRSKRFLWRCHGCKRQFTIRVGSVFEDSRIPLRHWCYAFWAACAGKKGVSAKQIQRQTGLSYKSALFMMHRIRHAMTPTEPAHPDAKLYGIVEMDETYVGGKPRRPHPGQRGDPYAPFSTKTPVVAMVQRGGDVRAMVVQSVNVKNLRQAIHDHVMPGSRVITDEHRLYPFATRGQTRHETVKHSVREYRRRWTDIHTNTIESFFAILKRQMYGTHHAVSKKHLHRYVSEASFKYNTRKMDDGARTEAAIRGAIGKRLRYREPIAG
jgi:transposase-like protein